MIEQHGYDHWSADGDAGDWSGIVLPEHLASEAQSKTGLSEESPYVIVPLIDGGLPATLIKYLG